MWGYLSLGAIVGWLIAPLLIAWARHLLMSVPQTDAAPVALATLGPTGAPLDGGALPHILPQLGRGWEAALRWGVVAVMPLALWRGATGAHHLPPAVAALALLACVGVLALTATLDGATHLIFAEVLAVPAALALVAGLAGGDWATLVVGGLVGGALMGALYLVGQVRYGTDALGWGDVQLGAALGVIVGWPGLLRILVWGMLLLLVVTLTLLATRRITTRSFVPLGSYLCAAAVASLLLLPPPWL